MRVPVYEYEVIKGKYQGTIVMSFDNAVFDAKHCIVPHPNTPFACFNDSGEYILFAGELKFISEYQMDIPDELEELYKEADSYDRPRKS